MEGQSFLSRFGFHLVILAFLAVLAASVGAFAWRSETQEDMATHRAHVDALVQAGRIFEARASAALLAADFPVVAANHLLVGDLALQLGDARAAEGAFLRASELSTSDAVALGLGRVALLDADAAAAERAFRDALATNPTNAFALSHLSRLRAEAGDFAEAVRLSDRAFYFAPTTAQVLADRAVVLHLLGDWRGRDQAASRAAKADAAAIFELREYFERHAVPVAATFVAPF